MTFAQPFSEYEVLARVGAGSMGTVFKAHHKKLDRIVALKVLKPSLGRDSRYVARLRREARIVASLNHPNIVTGYDLGQEGGYHFFVMEFVEGQSLRELLNEWGIFDEQRVLDVAMQITIALDHAYKRGVIHRDIKPANILIDKANVVKLTDMGLAKGPDNLIITRDGATVGTPQYISPEQARNPQDVDIRTDLYSLGATLFHMCTGQPPFRAETMANVLCKVLEERAPSASGINPDLSDGLNLIIRKLLSKEPARRYQTPAELLADLKRVQRAELPHVQVGDLDRGEDEAKPLGALKLGLLVSAGVALLASLIFLPNWGGSKIDPGTSKDESRQSYYREVEKKLERFSKTGRQIRCLDNLRREAVERFERDHLDDQKTRLVAALRGEIKALLRQQEKDLERTFEKLSWNRTKRDLDKLVEKIVEDEIGIKVTALPPDAAKVYEKGKLDLDHDLEQRMLARERKLERAIVEHREALRSRVQKWLRDLDFQQAETAMKKGLTDFDQVSEEVPQLADLPEKLRRLVDDARAGQYKTLESLITQLELNHRQSFDSGLKAVETAVEKILALGDARATRSTYTELKVDFEREFPRNFRDQHNPWPGADIRLRLLDKKIASAELVQLGEELRGVVRTTYLYVLTGELSKARRVLPYWNEGPKKLPLDKHIDLLECVIDLRSALLGSLLGTRKDIRLGKKVRTQKGHLTVELRRRPGEFVLEVPGQPKPIPLGLLRVHDLVDLLPDSFVDGLSPNQKAGLAVWYLLTGTKDVAFLIEGGPWAGFVRDEAAPLLAGLEQPEPDWQKKQQLLDDIRQAVADRRWSRARELWESVRTRYPEFASAKVQVLRELDGTIRGGQAKTELEERLRPQLLDGGTLLVSDGLGVSVEYRDLSRVGFVGGLPKGWSHSEPSGRVVFEGEHVAIDDAKTLSFPSLCATDKPITVEFEFALTAEKSASRMFFLTIHQATLGLIVLRDGPVAVFGVDRLRPGKELKVLTQKALLSAEQARQVYLVPGARHHLEVKLRPARRGGKTVLMSVRIDKQKVPFELSVVRPTGRISDAVVLKAIEPLEAYRIAFQGTGR